MSEYQPSGRKAGPKVGSIVRRKGGRTGIVGSFCPETAGDMASHHFAFIKAIDRYKREHNRPHPTWSEVLALTEQLIKDGLWDEWLAGMGFARAETQEAGPST
jgi:hypothetical protein